MLYDHCHEGPIYVIEDVRLRIFLGLENRKNAIKMGGNITLPQKFS